MNSLRAPQITGDDLRLRFEKKKSGAIKNLHDTARQRKPSLREENQPPASLEEFRHSLHRIRRTGIDRKRVMVDHDLLVQPAQLRRHTRSHEFPVGIEDAPEKQPIEPRDMIRNQEDGPWRAENIKVVTP